MSASPAQVLDYATPQARRRFDPAHSPPIPLLIGIVVFSAFLACTGVKIVPGGPFISLHADAAPALLSVGLVAFTWRSLRHGPIWRRLAVASVILCAVAVLFLVLATVVSFWLRTYARGALISW